MDIPEVNEQNIKEAQDNLKTTLYNMIREIVLEMKKEWLI